MTGWRIVGLVLLFAGCGEAPTALTDTTPPEPEFVAEFAPTSIVVVGNDTPFALSVSGDWSVNWTCRSSNPNVATVVVSEFGCLATGVSPGTVTITADITSSGTLSRTGARSSASAQLEVVGVMIASIDTELVEIGLRETADLTVTVEGVVDTPDMACWSSRSSVATVTVIPSGCRVLGVSMGEAIVTITVRPEFAPRSVYAGVRVALPPPPEPDPTTPPPDPEPGYTVTSPSSPAVLGDTVIAFSDGFFSTIPPTHARNPAVLQMILKGVIRGDSVPAIVRREYLGAQLNPVASGHEIVLAEFSIKVLELLSPQSVRVAAELAGLGFLLGVYLLSAGDCYLYRVTVSDRHGDGVDAADPPGVPQGGVEHRVRPGGLSESTGRTQADWGLVEDTVAEGTDHFTTTDESGRWIPSGRHPARRPAQAALGKPPVDWSRVGAGELPWAPDDTIMAPMVGASAPHRSRDSTRTR